MITIEKGAVSVTAELEPVSVVEDLATYVRRTNELRRAAERSGHGMTRIEPLTSPTHFVPNDHNIHL